MLSELIQKASLLSLLHRIDLDLAERVQKIGCQFCSGILDHANYPRKPWGGPANIPEELMFVIHKRIDWL